MTINLLPTTSATSNQQARVSQSSSSSIANLANEFSSLLANFASTQSNAGTSAAQTSSGTSAAQTSSGSPAVAQPTTAGNLAPGVEAFLFVSQTTTNAAPTQSSQPPLFASIDTNGDGLIGRQEFVNKFGGNGNDTAASQLFNVLDKNGDSEIDGTELASSNLNATTADGAITGSQASPGSASWSPNSLFQLLPGMQASSIPGSPNLPLFTRLDTNGDGLVGPAEFATAYGSNSAQAASAFAAIDTNNTGSITWSQLNAAQSPLSSGSSSASAGTTTTTFFAELIPVQSSSNGTSAPASSSSTTVPSSSSTGSSTSTPAAATTGPDTTTPAAATTTPGTTTPAAATTTPGTTTPAAATTTPAAATTTPATTTPAPSTSTLAAQAAAALSNTSTSTSTASSQTAANLLAKLLNSLTPNSSTTSG